MSNKKFYWLKLEAKFFDDLRIQKLRNISGGDTFTCIYLKLLLLSLENDGFIEFEGVYKNFDDEIAVRIRENPDNVKATLAFCKTLNMISLGEDSLYCEQVKNLTGSETQSTLRSRKHRELKKEALQCNTTATICNKNATAEKEKELELELDNKEIYKEKTSFLKKENFLFHLLEENFNVYSCHKELILDFIEYRKKIKKPLKTKEPIKTYIQELERLEKVGHSFEYSILQMKSSEWQTIKLEYLHKPETKVNSSYERKSKQTVNYVKELFDKQRQRLDYEYPIIKT